MKVSNPLTIIAIFAGVSEAMATIALIQLADKAQSIFIYFVMFFPTLIVVLFFYMLIYKNTALYAPSDFEDQNNYLKIYNISDAIGRGVDSVLQEYESSGEDNAKLESGKIKQAVIEAIKEEVIPSAAYNVLRYIKNNNEASVIEIATKLKMTIGSAGGCVNYLLNNGYIKEVRVSKINGNIYAPTS
ncbi:MarR family transcriptional regulator [Vibrio cholerae]|uniref:MarR family transcriptional regulator n=1 Tax=Vibrio cholerae TaxID=666 RepID=UPI002FDBB05D|nr:MarR family transcriptional regulator [Vibrio cholerae]EJL6503535.1 MarR family transcriptional regulator [Vibrio cholerae]